MSSVSKLYLLLSDAQSGKTIEGESRVKSYESQIVIDDWNWNLGFDASAPAGHKETPTPSVLAFGKLMDRASSAMLSAMKNGDELTGVLSLEEAAQSQFYLVIELQQVRLLSYTLNVKNEEKNGLIDEQWTLDYRSIELKYRVSGKVGEITTGKLVRPSWAASDAPMGQAAVQEQVLKLTADLSPDQLDLLWKQMKEASDKRTLSPGTTTTTLDA